ncbi:glutamine-hydrolyzing carbamoyl-phosphate synthase small subunit [Corynebacterium mendelii]|uniref:Carbamoyl phosphate synthase small chain n=1 Tax=Corynebacterium mendelii TaxID=2765362 RepID=A0A939IWV2_9CORY|nr:glutamine-hydrolyzing carbamoyl-phosphate synthase small subunit [Corynebacterium mendelii]MBN9643418.1 glutamine-hydrolyzing carbamoyl-phosphate synthase small subunit [Corynebacterium mendelii]
MSEQDSRTPQDNTCAQPLPAVLVLADGSIYRGEGFGAAGSVLGEAVFTTAMTGYQETMTDPSYHRQIVVATAPQIGNTGWNDQDNESRGNKIWVTGLVIRDLAHRVSNWRACRSLDEEMKAQNIPGIKGVDTRALVRHLRNHGSIAAGLFTGAQAEQDTDVLLDVVRNQPPMAGADLAGDVTTDASYTVEAMGITRARVVAFDMGIKTNTPRNFAARGIETVVVPATTTFEEISELHPDGVFVSNGPGDPATADAMVETVKKVLEHKIPFFGICFGNQIFGRALGRKTYKLKFGHRGINIPVKNHDTGAIEITAQNHGFAVEGTPGEKFSTPFGPAHVSHSCLNDGVVEGLALDNGLGFSVQYHPEAAAGPHDANPLFDQFIELMATHAHGPEHLA